MRIKPSRKNKTVAFRFPLCLLIKKETGRKYRFASRHKAQLYYAPSAILKKKQK